jgi:O-antigen/teichoic acid export membrane protein
MESGREMKTVSEGTRIKQNSAFALFANVFRMLTTMLMFVWIAHYFGPRAFGQFTLAHTYLALFYVAADFGIDIMLTTEVAFRRNETEVFIAKFFPLKICMSIVATVSMCILGFGLNLSIETRTLMLLLSLGIIGNAMTTFVFALLKAHEQFSFEATTSFWQQLFLLGGLLALALLKASIFLVAILFVVSRFFGFLFVLPKARKYFRVSSLHMTFQEGWKPLRQAVPYGLLVVFGMLYLQIDTVLVSLFRSDYEVGLYQSAMKVVMLVLAVPDVVSTAVLPSLSRYYHENSDQWKRLAHLLAKTTMFVGLPFGLIFLLYPDQVLSMIYRNTEFGSARTVLQILSFSVVVRLALDVYAVFLTSSGRQSRRTTITIFVTVCNIVLNLYAIPRAGIMGAAIVALITNIVAGVLYITSIEARLLAESKFYLREMFVVLCTVVFALILVVSQVNSFTIALALIVPFFGVTFWFVGYTADERSIVFTLPQQFN